MNVIVYVMFGIKFHNKNGRVPEEKSQSNSFKDKEKYWFNSSQGQEGPIPMICTEGVYTVKCIYRVR